MLKEECGVIGILGDNEAAKLSYLGLYALQHRGQDAAGIVTEDDGFADLRGHLRDTEYMAAHDALRQKYFLPVRPLALYTDAIEGAGFGRTQRRLGRTTRATPSKLRRGSSAFFHQRAERFVRTHTRTKAAASKVGSGRPDVERVGVEEALEQAREPEHCRHHTWVRCELPPLCEAGQEAIHRPRIMHRACCVRAATHRPKPTTALLSECEDHIKHLIDSADHEHAVRCAVTRGRQRNVAVEPVCGREEIAQAGWKLTNEK